MKAASHVRSHSPAILLVIALLVGLHVIWQAWLVAAAPYPARYDYDEGVYAETAAAAAGERLYAAVFLSQPPLLIGVIARAFHAFGRSLAAARGVAVAFSAVWLVSLAAIAACRGRPRAALWAVAIAGSAPAFVIASHTVQMEGPSEALAALAVALALAADRRPAGAWWGAAGVAAGLAVMTKFTAVTCLVPLAVIVATADRTAARTASLGAGMLLGAAAAVAWTGGPLPEMWSQAVAFHGAVARTTPADPGRTASLLAGFARVNWFVVALGLAGLAGAAGGRRSIVAAWLAADLAAVFLWKPVWPHHLVILVTPLAVLGAAAIPAAVRTPALRLVAGTMIVGWLAALAGTIADAVPRTSAPLRAAATQIEQAVPAGGWIVTDDPIVAFLAGRDVPPALCDTSETRMRAGWLTDAALTAAVAGPRVHGLVLWRGTFHRMVPEFVDQAAKKFPRRWTWGDGRMILAR